ncbi:hypothetical protein D9M68_972370 [compost metagenome]
MDVAFLDTKADVGDRGETAKILGEPLGLQRVSGLHNASLLYFFTKEHVLLARGKNALSPGMVSLIVK